MITCFEKKRLFVLFILFAFTLLFASCDNEDEKDTSIYQEKESFENYLTEKINGYVEEKPSELVDEQTSIWTLQPIRMPFVSLRALVVTLNSAIGVFF